MPIQDRYDYKIIEEVEAEMQRQIDRWGVQEHEPLMWNAILVEEVGEVSKAILETWFQGRPETDNGEQYRKELIQVAAVAISAIRAFDMANDPHKDMWLETDGVPLMDERTAARLTGHID